MSRSDFEYCCSPSEFSDTSWEIEISDTSPEDEICSTPKRKKIEEETSQTIEEIDGISELPDSILVNHILTLLPDTESAIRTGILSKRWQFLWTSIPVLRFYYLYGEPVFDFINLVDKTLNQCRYSKLKKFILDVSRDLRGVSIPSLDTWIGYAVSCNVEELEVVVYYKWGVYGFNDDFPVYQVPEFLFKNSFLTNLRLQSCVMAPVRQVSWPMLKKLSLEFVLSTNESIQNILLGSPMLESLGFRICDVGARININSASLKELVLYCYTEHYRGDFPNLEISGPNILSLDIQGYLSVSKLVLHSLPSLVKLCLDFSIDGREPSRNPDMWMKIFGSISHVPELAVGDFVMEVLSSLELDGWSSPLSKRTVLKMNFF